jgi:uncharacterized protein
MTAMFRKFLAALVALVAIAATATAPAHAQDAVLEAAKANGVVGEMYTGYLGVADPARATPDIRRRMDENNAKRLEIYTGLARDSGQTVAVIAALTAEKQINRTPAGSAVKPSEAEGWVLKR